MLRSDTSTTNFFIITKAQKHKTLLKFCEILCFFRETLLRGIFMAKKVSRA